MDLILLALAGLLLTALLVLAIRALRQRRGAWRVLVGIVAAGVVGWCAKIAIDLQQDPTSHNLWPFEIAGVATLALLALGLLTLAHAGTRWVLRPPGVAP